MKHQERNLEKVADQHYDNTIKVGWRCQLSLIAESLYRDLNEEVWQSSNFANQGLFVDIYLFSYFTYQRIGVELGCPDFNFFQYILWSAEMYDSSETSSSKEESEEHEKNSGWGVPSEMSHETGMELLAGKMWRMWGTETIPSYQTRSISLQV